jgi:hypothetical protein
MSIHDELSAKLKKQVGFSASDPATTSLSGPEGIEIAIDFTVVDSMSCSFREMRLRVPSLVDADFDVLEEWAKNLCSRVTYLLESVGPLELDAENSQVLIRSTPPDQQSGGSRFYEIMLRSHADGNFSLQRYKSENGRPGRERVDIQTTHEVLDKLLRDLLESIPPADA